MMTTDNSNIPQRWGIFHPDHLIDLLRGAGGYFPARALIELPSVAMTLTEAEHIARERMPALSDEKHEVVLAFAQSGGGEQSSPQAFSVSEIVSAHFFSTPHQQAARYAIRATLEAYRIPVGPPIREQPAWAALLDGYDRVLRDAVARGILGAWFPPPLELSGDFRRQVAKGFEHQQAARPDLLEPLPAGDFWAHVVAYNPGRRPFDEIEKVLAVQDLRQIIAGMGLEVKEHLKEIGERLETNFKQETERAADSPLALTQWLAEELAKHDSYLAQVDAYLRADAQQSFLASGVLYLTWRTLLLDKEYRGPLGTKKEVASFLKSGQSSSKLAQEFEAAIGQALYTVVYIGGPVAFQEALKEVRAKASDVYIPYTPQAPVPQTVQEAEAVTAEELNAAAKQVGRFLKKYRAARKAEERMAATGISKAVGKKTSQIEKGDLTVDEYLKVCRHYGIQDEREPLRGVKGRETLFGR